jgi:hypothetical protein
MRSARRGSGGVSGVDVVGVVEAGAGSDGVDGVEDVAGGLRKDGEFGVRPAGDVAD